MRHLLLLAGLVLAGTAYAQVHWKGPCYCEGGYFYGAPGATIPVATTTTSTSTSSSTSTSTTTTT